MAHKKKELELSRRRFLQVMGTAGVGVLSAPAAGWAGKKLGKENDKKEKTLTLPTRPFGKSGIQVPILALGGTINFNSNLVLLRQAFRMGVTYWDTARTYAGGNSEKGIGKYFEAFPEDRKSIFLVTKSPARKPADLEKDLEESLERMKTGYVDLFFVHKVGKAGELLDNEMKTWAEKMKSKGKFRLFGFSTHKNMEAGMMVAAKLGWIDGIMMNYNYRLMFKDEMKRAVEACTKAGIGLTAMKTQATFFSSIYADVGSTTDEAKALTKSFEKKGFSEEQAKLKAVWEDERIASVCSKMSSFSILEANVAAARGEVELTALDKGLMRNYAEKTAPGYCAGCAHICEGALDNRVPVSDILRYMMYAHGYGEETEARQLFRDLPEPVRANLLRADYTRAEKLCPHNIAIARMMKEASEYLA